MGKLLERGYNIMVNAQQQALFIFYIFIPIMRSCVCWIVLSHKNLLFFDTHITFFAWGSYVLTCKTYTINVVAGPVEFVLKFHRGGINFCRHTNPNLAWKIQLYGCQKMGNFGHDTNIFHCRICVPLNTISFILQGKLCYDLQNAQH